MECSPENLGVSPARVAQERKQIFISVLYCSHTGPACPPQGRSRAQNRSRGGVVFHHYSNCFLLKLLDLIRQGATTLPHRTWSSYRNVSPQWQLHSPLSFFLIVFSVLSLLLSLLPTFTVSSDITCFWRNLLWLTLHCLGSPYYILLQASTIMVPNTNTVLYTLVNITYHLSQFSQQSPKACVYIFAISPAPYFCF